MHKYVRMLLSTGLCKDKLLQFVLNSGFLQAPAASSPHHHGCYGGGLADHSICVAEVVASKGGDCMDIFLALVHDLCKTKLYVHLPRTEWRHGKPCLFASDKGVQECGHGLLTLRMLEDLGYSLDEDCAEAIRFHMGKWTSDAAEWKDFDESSKRSALRRMLKRNSRLARLCYADMYASHVLGR